MLEKSIVSPGKGSWASPVVLAKKKDGTMRFCVDYRKLNRSTIRDAYPIPRIDDTLDSLRKMKVATSLDATSGYWHVVIDEVDGTERQVSDVPQRIGHVRIRR